MKAHVAVTAGALLALFSLAGGAPTMAAPGCQPTLDDGAGPFGRGAPPRRAKIGTGHVLTGIVLSSVDCRPLAGAAIHLWQSNRRGEYARATSATVITNAAGRFRLEGPRPVAYEGRQAHIHLRVAARNHELLHTRYVLATPKTRRGSIRIVLLPMRL
ncbi:MAG TPA: hypothetical protein VIA10_12255 [Gaiellaceae bacterium]